MDFEELKREEKLNDLRRREKFENAVRQLGRILQVKGTYKIRNDDDAEKCLCALLDYIENHSSVAERLALVLKMNILRLVAKARRNNNDTIGEG